MWQATICDGCGQDKRRSMNPDMEGFYDVHHLKCYACESLEFQREQRRDVKYPLAHKEVVIDTRPPDDVPREWVPDLSPKDD